MKVRIAMIGPHGERDYVESLLSGGCPVICGNNPKLAKEFHESGAFRIVDMLLKNWLSPHVAVETELVAE